MPIRIENENQRRLENCFHVHVQKERILCVYVCVFIGKIENKNNRKRE